MKNNRGEIPPLPNRLLGRIGSACGLLIRHPRRAVNWLLGALAGAVWLVAATAHLGGSVSQKAGTAVMQPLTASHALAAIQATTISYVFSTPIAIALLFAGKRWINEKPLREAMPLTERRDKAFKGLLRRTEGKPVVHTLLRRFVAWENDKKHRWILTVLPFLAAWYGAGLLASYYTIKLPFASGNAITAMGGITMSVVIAGLALRGLPLVGLPLPSGGLITKLRSIDKAMLIEWRNRNKANLIEWWDTKKILSLVLPLGSAAGAIMMIPWGQHIDGMALLAALGGAVCSAVMIGAGKAMAHAGIQLKGTVISMVAGLIIGAPSLLTVHWTWEVFTRGLIAGFLSVAGAVLYYVAQGPLHLPKRMAGLLSANGPVLSSLVGLVILHQALGASVVTGICTIFAVSVLSATLTGSKEELAREKQMHHAFRDEDMTPGGDPGWPVFDDDEDVEKKEKQPKPQRRAKSWRKRRGYDKAHARRR
ncbi:hypothetical protein AB0L00_26015 [Actinoallomurus sp. NPDC052308]|uniref:hypothetical protein n=1 Tax=Actinoallomurus sp. NPDC052308 TaxID=3155530 RepID=UPI0034224300